MTPGSPQADTGRHTAQRELEQLHQATAEARASLAELHAQVAAAEMHLGSLQTARLVEVNEGLVLSAVQAQVDNDIAQAALAKAEQSAQRDPLTALPNRIMMRDRLQQAIVFARRHRTRVAVLFMDFNRFKQINDTLGHAVGDEALQVAARCFVASVRAQDTVSRFGGDEFVIVLPELASASDAELVADKVNLALADARCVGATELQLTVSIGISIYPDAGDDADTLIRHADIAMYLAKAQGTAIHVFQPADAGRGTMPAPASTVDKEQRMGLLQEANERLVVAIVTARALQGAAEHASRSQARLLAWVASELRKPMADASAADALSAREALRTTFLQQNKLLGRQRNAARRLHAQTHPAPPGPPAVDPANPKSIAQG